METTMEANNTTKKHPTYVIFQVIGEKDMARWIRVGAGWTNRDGKGVRLIFDSYPVVGRTVIREVSQQDDTTGNGGQQ
jgi:hypothetical protein